MQNLDSFYAPPARIHFVDDRGQFHWRPFVYRSEMTNLLDASYTEITDRRFRWSFFSQAMNIGFWAGSREPAPGRNPEAGTFYVLGADELGRDVLARILAGARTSLLVIVVGIALYAAIGVSIGSLAGWLGDGWMPFSCAVRSLYSLSRPCI